MPAFNFKAQFAGDVESGAKAQTIRAKRKHRPRVGQTAHCFTGMRTRACRKLGAWPIRAVYEIWILDGGILVDDVAYPHVGDGLDGFARRDGFTDWTTMRAWFRETHGLPFHGDLVQWDRPKETKT